MSRVLVTGGTGFIGRGALQPLIDAGFEVHAVSSREAPSDAPPEVVWHQCDLLDADSRAALIPAVAATHLLHMAWYAEPGKFWESPLNADWADASIGLLREFAGAGGRRAVLAGSCAEYRWEEETRCVEDATPLEPATFYGASKARLREEAAEFASQSGLSLAWGRIFFVYGPYEDPRRLVSSIAKALLEGTRAETSHGRQLRDFLYAPELADAFVALLVSDAVGAFNMASGEAVSIASLAEMIASSVGRTGLLALGAREAPEGEPALLVADTTRLRTEVGWSPALSLEEGIGRTVGWWRDAIAGGPPRAPA